MRDSTEGGHAHSSQTVLCYHSGWGLDCPLRRHSQEVELTQSWSSWTFFNFTLPYLSNPLNTVWLCRIVTRTTTLTIICQHTAWGEGTCQMGAGVFSNTLTFMCTSHSKAGWAVFFLVLSGSAFHRHSVVSILHQTNWGSEMLNCLSGSVGGGNSDSDTSAMIPGMPRLPQNPGSSKSVCK